MSTEIREQDYRETHPPSEFLPIHEWARTHPPTAMYELVRMVLTWPVVLIYRARALGLTNVPESGGFICAPNHFSNMDHFFAGCFTRRKIRFMAKSQLFHHPVLRFIFRTGGIFPVMRGRHDEDAFLTANSILDRGQCVGMYCEGGRSRTGTLGDPKPGVGRLALESGVPVVPVTIHGSASVRGWTNLRFPKVTIVFGEALRFDRVERPDRKAQLEAARRIFDRVKLSYDALEREGRSALFARERGRD